MVNVYNNNYSIPYTRKVSQFHSYSESFIMKNIHSYIIEVFLQMRIFLDVLFSCSLHYCETFLVYGIAMIPYMAGMRNRAYVHAHKI